MRPEKQLIAKEYARRLNASPFFLVVTLKYSRPAGMGYGLIVHPNVFS